MSAVTVLEVKINYKVSGIREAKGIYVRQFLSSGSSQDYEKLTRMELVVHLTVSQWSLSYSQVQ